MYDAVIMTTGGDSQYVPSTYGDRIADVYDDIYTPEPDLDEGIVFLANLAGNGLVLELGIGTGRMALPLHQNGIQVHGIDASKRIVEKLREKAGGDRIPVSIGNMVDVEAPGDRYHLVYVVANTFYGLTTQHEQVRCFRNVAARLHAGGLFVLQCFVPNLERYQHRQLVRVARIDVDSSRTDYSTVDPVSQVLRMQHVVVSDGQIRTYPVLLRYCWPGELDLMAQLAGLELSERWASWKKAEFNPESSQHISVYKKP